ncbi:MAG TPA: nuclear transport factor 2 family protein [Allosphingosinicella sp.]|nr:nuclear transport factor 2 family protein [Allosphingosinicella sp.]
MPRVGAGGATLTTEDEAEIRALIEERAAAIRAKDSSRAVATLAPEVVSFELAPPLSLGPAEARDEAALSNWLGMWDGAVQIEIAELEIAASGDVGWSRSLNRLSGTMKNGRRVEMWMRSTLGFRKIDGAWKIAHGHSSVPFLMDGSYRAAIDLQPKGA